MIRRLGLAVMVAGTALAGLSAATAAAAPATACGDYHWLGAAGSGQRDAAGLVSNGGMGGVVYQSYRQLQADLAQSGQTITAEAVEYPAAPVPLDGGLGGWMGFMDSVKAGADATAKQLTAFTAQCPDTKVVLAGYSQGAMVIHRNLENLADDPQVVAALLVADGDRLPGDTTINLGSTATTAMPDAGQGMAQEHSFLASAPTSKLPASIGARTISVCDVGDPVCDYDPKSTADPLSPASLAIHTSYAPTSTGGHAWVQPLHGLVASAASASGSPSPSSTSELAAQRLG